VSVVGERAGIPIFEFETTRALWDWLAERGTSRSDVGVWVALPRSGSERRSVNFHDLLEAGIAFGWSESTRVAFDAHSYLQRFMPRRRPGTLSSRNEAIASRLRRDGRMTAAGELALRR
jgi:hypothetical protein